MAALRNAGFTNIETVALGDLTTGWLKDPGEVKEVNIAGSTSFDGGDAFRPDAAIVVSYHSFPEDPADTVLTVESSEDLKALLNGPSSGQTLKSFVDKHWGETVQIDGHISYFLYGSDIIYSTADVTWGDAGSALGTGPVFRFTPMSVPDASPIAGYALVEGQNVRLTATIGSAYVFEKSSTYDPAKEDRIVVVVQKIESR